MKFLLDLIAGVYQPWEPSKEVAMVGDHMVVNLPHWIDDVFVYQNRDASPNTVTLSAEEHPLEVTGAKYSKTLQIPVEWNDDYHVNVDTENHVVILYPAWISTIGDNDNGNSGNASTA